MASVCSMACVCSMASVCRMASVCSMVPVCSMAAWLHLGWGGAGVVVIVISMGIRNRAYFLVPFGNRESFSGIICSGMFVVGGGVVVIGMNRIEVKSEVPRNQCEGDLI